MEKREITIQGETFTVNQPYAEGHALTGPEAKALNQVRAENIRNNLASKVKKANNPEDETTMEEVVAFAKKYDKEYDFSIAAGGGGRAALDPVEKEARKVARKVLTDNIKAQGGNVKDYDKDSLTTMVNDLAATNADIIAEAKKRVKAAEGLSEIKLDIPSN